MNCREECVGLLSRQTLGGNVEKYINRNFFGKNIYIYITCSHISKPEIEEYM